MSSHAQLQDTDERRRPIRLSEFADLDDEAFLRTVYWRLLGRRPDQSGYEVFLERLRGGTSRVEILGDIRYSREGKQAARPVAGLAWRYAWRLLLRLPGVGILRRRWRGVGRASVAAMPARHIEVENAPERALPGNSPPRDRDREGADAAYIGGLLAYTDSEFINAAYRQFLGRGADEGGRGAYLARLLLGESRSDVLNSIRESPEARAKGPRVFERGETSWTFAAGGPLPGATGAVPVRAVRDGAARGTDPVLYDLVPSEVSSHGACPEEATATTRAETETRHQLLARARKWKAGARKHASQS